MDKAGRQLSRLANLKVQGLGGACCRHVLKGKISEAPCGLSKSRSALRLVSQDLQSWLSEGTGRASA